MLRSMPVSADVCKLRSGRHAAGSQLAQPRTKEEILVLTAALRQSGHDSMWINLHTDATGKWKWSGSGEPLTAEQSRWAPGQPDGDGECVEMWPDGSWNDRDCTVAKVFACETAVE